MNTATAQAQQQKPHPWRTYVDQERIKEAKRQNRQRYNAALKAEKRRLQKGW